MKASRIGCDLPGHLAKHLAPEILPKAYHVIVAIWGYPTLILLTLATWRHRARLRRHGGSRLAVGSAAPLRRGLVG